MEKEPQDLDIRLALLEQKLDLILENHLAHVQRDMDWIKKVISAIGIAVVLEAGYIIANFNGMV